MDLRHVNHIWDRVIPRYFSVMFYVKQRYFCVSPRRAGVTPCPVVPAERRSEKA